MIKLDVMLPERGAFMVCTSQMRRWWWAIRPPTWRRFTYPWSRSRQRAQVSVR